MNEISRTEHELERRARRRVGLKLGWYTHALVYALVNAGLIALDATTGDYRWSVFPLAGWGLGLAIHGLVVLLALRDGWRARLIAAEVEALKRRGR
jgi:hypothetical protein